MSVGVLLTAALAVGMATVAACGRDGSGGTSSTANPPPDSLGAPADVYPNVHVLPDDVASQAVRNRDTIFFPSAVGAAVLALKVDDVIVSGAGDGFILKVTSLPAQSDVGPMAQGLHPLGNGGGAWISFTTTLGTFLDVFRNVDATLTYTPAPLAEDASGYILSGDDTAGVKFSRASIGIGPSVTMSVQIADGNLDSFITTIDTTVSATMAIMEFVQGQGQWSGSKTVWTSPSIPIRFLLGGVPIVSSLHFDLILSATASAHGTVTLELGKQCSETLTSTVSWTSTAGWGGGNSRQIDCSPIGPTFTLQADAAAQAKDVVDAKWTFYGSGALDLAVNAHVGLTATACPAPGQWQISSGYGADVSADFSPFGVELGSLSQPLFDQSDPIASGEIGGVPASVCPCMADGGGSLCSGTDTCLTCGTTTSCEPWLSTCCNGQVCSPTQTCLVCPQDPGGSCAAPTDVCPPADGGVTDAATDDAGMDSAGSRDAAACAVWDQCQFQNSTNRPVCTMTCCCTTAPGNAACCYAVDVNGISGCPSQAAQDACVAQSCGPKPAGC